MSARERWSYDFLKEVKRNEGFRVSFNGIVTHSDRHLSPITIIVSRYSKSSVVDKAMRHRFLQLADCATRVATSIAKLFVHFELPDGNSGASSKSLIYVNPIVLASRAESASYSYSFYGLFSLFA